MHISDEGGLQKLVSALKMRAKQVGVEIGQISSENEDWLWPASTSEGGGAAHRGMLLQFPSEQVSEVIEDTPKPGRPRLLGSTVHAVVYCEAPVATTLPRILAASFNGSLIVLIAAFGLAILGISGSVMLNARYLAIVFGLSVLLYSFIWAVLGRESPGFRICGLRVVTFDGFAPERSIRLMRAAAAFLSTTTLLGVLWSLVDEEGLSWHDHISRSFPTPGSVAKDYLTRIV